MVVACKCSSQTKSRITMANFIPQLFKSNYESSPARAIISPVNGRLFGSPGLVGDAWGKAYSEAKPGDVFAPLTKFDSDESCNVMLSA